MAETSWENSFFLLVISPFHLVQPIYIYIYLYLNLYIYIYIFIFIYYKDFSPRMFLVFLQMLISYNVWNFKKPWKICDRLWIYTITNLQAFLKWSLDYWDEKFSRLGRDKVAPLMLQCCMWTKNPWEDERFWVQLLKIKQLITHCNSVTQSWWKMFN